MGLESIYCRQLCTTITRFLDLDFHRHHVSYWKGLLFGLGHSQYLFYRIIFFDLPVADLNSGVTNPSSSTICSYPF